MTTSHNYLINCKKKFYHPTGTITNATLHDIWAKHSKHNATIKISARVSLVALKVRSVYREFYCSTVGDWRGTTLPFLFDCFYTVGCCVLFLNCCLEATNTPRRVAIRWLTFFLPKHFVDSCEIFNSGLAEIVLVRTDVSPTELFIYANVSVINKHPGCYNGVAWGRMLDPGKSGQRTCRIQNAEIQAAIQYIYLQTDGII